MWISRAACFWMASTTRGWQCPVATTAIPALKSRKRLPSTSWTMAPAALSTTIGYPRVYEDDTARASRSMIVLARGPGIGPERWGRSMRTGSKVLFMWRLLLCSLLVERLKTCTPYRRAPLVADGNLVGPEQPRAGCGGCGLHGYILTPKWDRACHASLQSAGRVGRPILAAAGFSRLPVLPSPPGDIQAPPLFH